jgi:histidyl-tRNA synthetase
MTLAEESMRCAGMHDLGPEEMERFRRIEQAFRETCSMWGFSEIRTPVIEHLHLFTSAGTLSPQMLGRVYSFLDWDGWSGERVVLRPDATIPAARLYWEQFRSQVAKFYYVENLFRFDPSDGRREIWQCGAELIGDSWPLGDIETISIVRAILARLGFPAPTVRLSHTGIIRSILSAAGYGFDQQLALYDRLIEGDLTIFDDVEARLPQASASLAMLRDLTGGHVDGLENLRSAFALTLPEIVPPIEELQTIASTLQAAGWPYVLDLTIVRGFEYYTGPVFYVSIDGQNVAGGGRYDGLVASHDGHFVPACGFAISVEPLLRLVSDAVAPETAAVVDILAAGASPEELSVAIATAANLHASGIAAELVRSDRDADSRWQLAVTRRGNAMQFRLRKGGSGSEIAVESLENAKRILMERAV